MSGEDAHMTILSHARPVPQAPSIRNANAATEPSVKGISAWQRMVSLAALITSMCACNPVSAPDSSPVAAPASTPERVVSVSEQALPGKYRAALPTDLAGWQALFAGERTDMPPPNHVIDSVLAGDSDMLARVEAAAKALPSSDKTAFAEAWNQATGYHDASPTFCQQVAATMAGPDTTLRDALIGPYVQDCVTDTDLSWIERADTPAFAVLRYYESARFKAAGRREGFSPRFASIIADQIASSDKWKARQAAFLLADRRHPDAWLALKNIHAGLSDTAKADEVAMAFLDSDDLTLKAIGRAACQRKRDEPLCDGSPNEFDGLAAQDPAVDPNARQQMADRLLAMGFSRMEGLDLNQVEGSDASTLLQAARHAFWFDVETGTFPNEHDRLLRHLAALVSPALDSAVFEEIAPDIEDEAGVYQLAAYLQGKRYALTAENLGDWYDLDAVLLLANRMLADADPTQRLVVLATGDQTAIVLGGKISALQQAAQEGLIEFGDSKTAEQLGKGFEAEVMQRLESESGGN